MPHVIMDDGEHISSCCFAYLDMDGDGRVYCTVCCLTVVTQ